ncbi:MAG: UvrD-helicase domain-containing protein [Gemmatimonadetes bacterium]|nr:UvrD-helicase domain-containing protein [Gemmatimonadota bacterium]
MTSRQHDAIEAPLGPVLVVAGPGAGKTYCLIGRVSHLLQQGIIPADRICAVTFTNRAAEEITTRLRASIGHAAEDITRGTLHALCLGILREHSEASGLARGFGVGDDEYQRVILGRLGVAAKRRGPVLTRFGRHRLQGYPLSAEEQPLFRRYTAYLRKQNLIDFDDIIAVTAQCLERHPAVADAVSARWDYVLVDEFQDLNAAQYAIVRRIARPHGNFFAVGDDEQSIFSWTGADPGILAQFRKDYQVEPIILDENRRCSRQIFETARRLLQGNRSLFEKQLRAERESQHAVQTRGSEHEAAEAKWLLEDLAADHAASGLSWGEYAVLYRKHSIGEKLEVELLQAGIPCRLAPGRALPDDSVIAYIMASLRLITRPGDAVAVEAAAKPLPEDLREHVRTIARSKKKDFLAAMRDLAYSKGDASRESRIAWRFIRYVENLTALARTGTSLRGLVNELLSQRVNRFENRLEERHAELSDPLAMPAAAALADRFSEAGGAGIWIAPCGGLDLALRRMVQSAGFGCAPGPADARVVVTQRDAGHDSLALVVFKALQIARARAVTEGFPGYVAFDFETTDLDVDSCGVVEIGAVRVTNGQVAERFHRLVRPERPISSAAAEVHGYTDADVKDAPSFAEVWPAFREFVGDRILVAHNGQEFDVPVLERMTGPSGGVGDIVFFDTLPLARALHPASRKLEDLAALYGIGTGRSHHALDDVLTLVEVFGRLNRDKLVRARKSSLANVLDWLGVALVLDPAGTGGEECQTLLDIARPYALGRYSDCLPKYEADREVGERLDAPPVAEVVERLGGEQRMARIRAEKSTAEQFAAELDRLERLISASENGSITESIDHFLDLVALSTSQGVAADPQRVNLLTLHSTKGLEFSRVYVVGAEDRLLPGMYDLERNLVSEIEEARRLLYVGMTRAKDRLVLTHTESREGDTRGGTKFLEEMGLVQLVRSEK